MAEICNLENCEIVISQRIKSSAVIEYPPPPLKVTEGHSKWLKITQAHSKRHCWVGRVLVPISILYWNFVCISYRFWDIQRQRWRDLETGGRGRSRSL